MGRQVASRADLVAAGTGVHALGLQLAQDLLSDETPSAK
jgi:hypothetical protein